jgi:hypothetical protein
MASFKTPNGQAHVLWHAMLDQVFAQAYKPVKSLLFVRKVTQANNL